MASMATMPMKSTIPELPSYTLSIRSSLVPGISDVLLQLIAPVIAYWLVSLAFHLLDEYDLFPQYRLHTPAEIEKRNKVSRYEVLRDVILQQCIQTAFGLAIAYFDPPEMVGREQYDVALWARRIRITEAYIPTVLALFGINAPRLATKLVTSAPTAASILSGGIYPFSTFAPWELLAAKAIYHLIIPAIQFTVAICWVDTWQYFLHRWMHLNKTLYVWLHSRHHKLYVPYAYGALYNHPLEGFLLDTLGTGLAYLATGMTVRQGLVFFTCSTIKTVDDHCGYAFPWDPLQHVTDNNAAYHDIHHQTWGVKTNFSQPFFTFWDRALGTTWTGGDVSARYERERIKAQKKQDTNTVTNCPPVNMNKARIQAISSQEFTEAAEGPSVQREERREERDARKEVQQQQEQQQQQRIQQRTRKSTNTSSMSHSRRTSLANHITSVPIAVG